MKKRENIPKKVKRKWIKMKCKHKKSNKFTNRTQVVVREYQDRQWHIYSFSKKHSKEKLLKELNKELSPKVYKIQLSMNRNKNHKV